MRELLSGIGYRAENIPRDLDVVLANALPEGSFASREVLLAGDKCDVLVRLRDGRLLAIECKVSNTAINSYKRLIRETGGKANRWRTSFGDLNLMTAAVLAGVFTLNNLLRAQKEYGMSIFWQHRLEALTEFVSAIG